MKFIIFTFLISVSFCANCFSQQNTYSSDELFSQARGLAFDQKDYQKAILLTKMALSQSPDYTDLSVFLGRLYTWTDKIDSAQFVFENLQKKGIADEDYFIAYGSLLYWNDITAKANEIVGEGLVHHPQSEGLLILKAKIEYVKKDYLSANKTLVTLINLNPGHTEGRVLSNKIKDYVAKNAIGLSYSFTHFDKQFADNWHIASLSYKRMTSLGSLIFRTNFANKFASNGLQFEMEAYPRINDIFYLYVGAGYSEDVGIFPKYRTGASLYANLPQSFEGEVGFRQLYFSSNIWMYTASIGKYYKNFWFNLRTYLTPNQEAVSHSYTGTLRYYTKGANDYIGFQLGTGISPEENRNNLLVLDEYKLKTFKVGGDYNFSIGRTNLFGISMTYFNQEYRLDEKGNQFDISLSYSKIF
ncbi:YaiO family outer membrane beta-barrel protein [Sphingobacterium bovistauri]|uniref:YaiO family outer membrane beta-barrel protein n=1 Tax=Sphingobacterium bovistauri TaxID=2781959 RepID=A0ABS7Z6G8_9SPHI|nr:YaiO family outer membrane beta-barrel protein [Sphingobacterium bovistauri]MCA5005791.1 YaiO family outer membrane beta-barrel protein [Sphingobacterium bovistauri]